MAKDNIIQFPTKHKQTAREKIDILERRVSEIQMENDIMRADIEYLHDAIKTNVGELHEILKELSVLAGFEKPIYSEGDNELDVMQNFFGEVEKLIEKLNEDKDDK